MKPEVLVIIPARAGSKRVPKKNIAIVGGKPLLCYTVAAALEAELVDRVVVSTDSAEFAEIAKKCGAEVPCLRPAHLAQDNSNVNESHLHMLDYLREEEGYSPDFLVTLAPAMPLHTAADIDAAIRMAQEPGTGAVTSVHEKEHRSSGATLSLGPDGLVTEMTWHQVRNEGEGPPPPPIYQVGGGIAVMRPEDLEKVCTVYLIPGLRGYVMPLERCLDIDLPYHSYLADLILKDIRWQALKICRSIPFLQA